jgi:hypothetical protein
MAKMKVMTPRQTLRIILLPLVAPLPRPALPPLALLASDDSDTLLELRGKEKEPTCGCGGRNAPDDGSMACLPGAESDRPAAQASCSSSESVNPPSGQQAGGEARRRRVRLGGEAGDDSSSR